MSLITYFIKVFSVNLKRRLRHVTTPNIKNSNDYSPTFLLILITINGFIFPEIKV